MERHVHQYRWEQSGTGVRKKDIKSIHQENLTTHLAHGSVFPSVVLFQFHHKHTASAWKTLSALSKDQLLDPRWLLEACAKAPCAMWNSVLTVDPDKQLLFLERSLA